MYGTCYIRDVVPCGLGHRLIVSRGRGNIYELNDSMMIDGYSQGRIQDLKLGVALRGGANGLENLKNGGGGGGGGGGII